MSIYLSLCQSLSIQSLLLQSDEQRAERSASERTEEERRAQRLAGLAGGCSHDHSAEQRIYDLSTDEKLAACVRFKNLGNLFFREGQFTRAAERFQRVLVYYEYTFPDDEAEQQQLDDVRATCVLNAAACKARLGSYTDAVGLCTQAIRHRPRDAKAYYRRARAHMELVDYTRAAADLRRAYALAPTSQAVRAAALELRRRHALYRYKSQRIAASMGRGYVVRGLRRDTMPKGKNKAEEEDAASSVGARDDDDALSVLTTTTEGGDDSERESLCDDIGDDSDAVKLGRGVFGDS